VGVHDFGLGSFGISSPPSVDPNLVGISPNHVHQFTENHLPIPITLTEGPFQSLPLIWSVDFFVFDSCHPSSRTETNPALQAWWVGWLSDLVLTIPHPKNNDLNPPGLFPGFYVSWQMALSVRVDTFFHFKTPLRLLGAKCRFSVGAVGEK